MNQLISNALFTAYGAIFALLVLLGCVLAKDSLDEENVGATIIGILSFATAIVLTAYSLSNVAQGLVK